MLPIQTRQSGHRKVPTRRNYHWANKESCSLEPTFRQRDLLQPFDKIHVPLVKCRLQAEALCLPSVNHCTCLVFVKHTCSFARVQQTSNVKCMHYWALLDAGLITVAFARLHTQLFFFQIHFNTFTKEGAKNYAKVPKKRSIVMTTSFFFFSTCTITSVQFLCIIEKIMLLSCVWEILSKLILKNFTYISGEK